MWDRFVIKKLELSDNVTKILPKLFVKGKKVQLLRDGNTWKNKALEKGFIMDMWLNIKFEYTAP